MLMVVALLAVSGVAAAADEESDDTVFNFGYDQDNGVLVWDLSPNDGLYDCTLQTGGPFNATYGVSNEGLVYVDGLTDGSDMPVMFEPRPQDELADGLEEAEEPATYTGADGECGLSGGSVAGPNGQVNHGMVMKLFNSVFDGKARGCVVRHLAQSDLGKGDQQVKVEDVDPESDPLVTGDTGVIEFETAITDCLHERDGSDEGPESRAAKPDKPAKEGHGKPDWAGKGKPEWAGKGKPEWAGKGKQGQDD
jgi:hypothetical protein